ncbi:hypothetical protein L1987_79882 [Smallanthus sonchifolius]|uniref:Uncharacterized protein n=1 Tax=Smallanthus sonchifolius TaxID=185202 RepID=A0ACB8YLK6_9ASTR|nr:hypothetical protein L1987_79882 [Smallanthus sonchifolius]
MAELQNDAVEETMKHVTLTKELLDFYSGPNRSTAKKQGEELEGVAKTLPASAPQSIKRFADRAVLSLQSNPGWGFNRKCQFMDKLVWEVSQSYKCGDYCSKYATFTSKGTRNCFSLFTFG